MTTTGPPLVDRGNVVTADLAALPTARTSVEHWLDVAWSEDAHRRDDIVLIFVELLTNAISASPPGGSVRYCLRSLPREIVLRFVNLNHRVAPITLGGMPDPDAVSGRGLALAQAYSDRLVVHSAGAVVDISAHFLRSVRTEPVLVVDGSRPHR